MKHAIREKILRKRKSVAKTSKTKSSKIAKKVILLPEFRRACTILAYVPGHGEVDTAEIIKSALMAGKTFLLPKMVAGKIVACEFTSKTKLRKGRFGIPQPVKCIAFQPKNIDLVLVPGVAFDLHGHRLGYGKGYYDKFLVKAKKAAKIGLAFEFQIVKKLPSEAHDVKMDKIVTERRVVSG